jgi:hypothetical protein
LLPRDVCGPVGEVGGLHNDELGVTRGLLVERAEAVAA